MSQSSTPVEIAIEHRRSTRAVLALPIVVKGVDALHEPFRENTNTVMVSCHGCKYQSKHYVPRGSVVEIEIPRSRQGTPRQVSGKVIWVQRPRNTREVFHIAVDFEVPGNVWGIPSPPGDWFPVPGDPEPSAPEKEDTTASWDESEIASTSKTTQIKAEAATAAREANAVEVEIVSGDTRINAEIRSVIENTVKAAVTRLAKSIADEAREERIAAAAQLDAKVQQAVEAAIAKLPSPQRKKSKKRN